MDNSLTIYSDQQLDQFIETSAGTTALEYRQSGLSVFPLPSGAKSDSQRWERYRHLPMNAREIGETFNGHPQNVAIVAGSASGNLVNLDCDTRQSYRETVLRLYGLGVHVWTIRRPPNGSKHDGGGALVFRAPWSVASGKRGDMDIIGEGSYFLAPPSLHPDGGVYRSVTSSTIQTLDSLDGLDWLDLQPAPQPRPRRNIPRLAWQLLNGNTTALARYADKNTGAVDASNAEMAIICSLIRAGFDFGAVSSLLYKYPGPGHLAKVEADPKKSAAQYLRLSWRNAQEWLAENEGEAVALARRLERWALSRPWPGRTGSTSCAVYLAHCTIVQRCGRDPHGASVRELAETAGIGRKTAGKANWRLVADGLLEHVEHNTVSCPHRWRLVEQDVCKSTPLYPPPHDGVGYFHTGHDVFRWGALGKSGCEIFTHLQLSPKAHVKDLAALTGRHRTTVKPKLELMRKVGLVEPLGDDYWRVVDNPDLDQAARGLNVSGAGFRQRRQHRRDRVDHNWQLSRGRE